MDPDSLIGSAERTRFEHGFRERRTTSASSNDRLRFSELWPEWLLDDILSLAAMPASDAIRLILRGKDVSPATYRDRAALPVATAIGQLHRAGASINVTRMEDYSNVILSLSRHLEVACDCPVQCNLYMTPGQARGLGAHTDAHDVLVLQLVGEKDWNLGSDAGGSSQSFTLRSGEWLFVPQGVRHEVLNRASGTSVHLTIGFHPLSWGELFRRALVEGRKRNPALNVPVDVSTTPPPAEIESRLRELLPFVDLPGERTRYRAAFPELGTLLPDGEAVPSRHLASIDETTAFAWNPLAAKPREARGYVDLDLPYRRAPLALRPEFGEVVRHMQGAEIFQVGDFAAALNFRMIPLCRFLAANSFIKRVASTSPPGPAPSTP